MGERNDKDDKNMVLKLASYNEGWVMWVKSITLFLLEYFFRGPLGNSGAFTGKMIDQQGFSGQL